jgi:hypothetical protein
MPPVQLSLHDLTQLVIIQTQNGRSRREIVETLVERGWPETTAVRFVDLTLAAQNARQASASQPDEQQLPTNTHPSFSIDEDWWKVVLAVLVITAICMACLLSIYAQ